MASTQQRITMMKIKMDEMEKTIKRLEKTEKQYESIITCEYFIGNKSYKLNSVIARLIKRTFAVHAVDDGGKK